MPRNEASREALSTRRNATQRKRLFCLYRSVKMHTTAHTAKRIQPRRTSPNFFRSDANWFAPMKMECETDPIQGLMLFRLQGQAPRFHFDQGLAKWGKSDRSEIQQQTFSEKEQRRDDRIRTVSERYLKHSNGLSEAGQAGALNC